MEDYRDPERREKFVQELHEAFSEVGFIAVINTGVDQSVLDNAYSSMEEFFHQPFEEKMIACDPETAGERGYTPGESAKGQTEKDFKEFYSVGRKGQGHLENVWPKTGDFQNSLSGLYTSLDMYKEQFEEAIASAIGVEGDFFTKMTGDGDVLLRAIHYFASPPSEQFWAAEHTDIGLFTILPRATAAGLQVKNKEGEWIDVKVPEDAFIINVGDMLQNITNGEFVSSRHRVVATEGGYERFAVVCFVHPKDEDRLDPLSQCIKRTGGVQKFADATRKELFEERMIDLGLASDSMMEHLAESDLMDRLVDLGRASPEAMGKLREKGLASEKVLAELEKLENPIFDATIPVIDLSEYLNPETKEACLQTLYSACQEVGFFAVINTGVDPRILDAGYESIIEFFSLPMDEKMDLFDKSVNGQRGYIPGESAKGEAACDFKEFLHVGREISKKEASRLRTWKNLWPEEGELKEDLYGLFEALEQHKVLVESALAEAIGMPFDFFTNMTEEGDVLLRAIHYPKNPPKNQVWAAEHTDIDLFTILPRATAKGLQVKNNEGEWIDVKVPENAFIVNVGDMLENITNGEFRSSLHRVVADSDNYERYSLVHFVHPRSEDRLDPLSMCVERTGGVQKYADATRLELLEERLVDLDLASDAMIKDLAESGLMEGLIALGRASPDAMQKLRDAGLASQEVIEELARLEAE